MMNHQTIEQSSMPGWLLEDSILAEGGQCGPESGVSLAGIHISN